MSATYKTCPYCRAQSIKPAGTLAAAFGAGCRCPDCGAGLKSGVLGGAAISVATVTGIYLWLVVHPVVGAVMAATLFFVMIAVSSLKVDTSDPISIRKQTRDAIRAGRNLDESE